MQIRGFHDHCLGAWLHNHLSGSEKNCIVDILFCIFITIITVVVAIIISFVVLLNCLYVNLQVLFFVHSAPHPTGQGGASGRLHDP